MIPSRRTLGVLSTVMASLGTLGAAASAQAQTAGPADTTPPPTITSVAINGHDVAANNGTFYTNDTTDPATVTVTGDPSASSIQLDAGATGWQYQTPADGVATFNVPAPAFSSSFNSLLAEQTVNGTTSTEGFQIVQTDVVPYLEGIDLRGGGTYSASNLHLGAAGGIPGDVVELFIDGTEVAAADADSNGLVQSFDLSSLSPGYHTASVKSVDASVDGQGNVSDGSAPIGFYLEPAAPTVQSPASAPNWPYVNTGQPPITVDGVVPGATVNLYELNDGQPGPSLDTVTNSPGGTVTLTPSAPVADGFDNFVVTQTVGGVSSDYTDESAGANLHIVTSAPQLGSDVAYAPYTNNNEPSFTFEVPDAGGDANAHVQLINAKSGQTLAESTLQGYRWVPTAPLPDRAYSVYAVVTDDLGDVGAASNTINFTIDTVPPSTPSFTSPSDSSTVTTSQPTITVHGDAGTTMCVSIDEQTENEDDLPCQTADGNGNATFTPDTALSDGPHSLYLSSWDQAGNSSDASATITVDTGNTGGGNGGGTNPTTNPTQPQQPKPPTPPTVTTPVLPGGGVTVQPGKQTQVNLQVSAPGTVTVTIEQHVGGRWVPAGTETLTATQAGPLPLALGTSFGGRNLAPGSYRMAVQESANGQSSSVAERPLTVTAPANGPHGQPRLLSVAVNPRSITWRQGLRAPRLWLTFLVSRNATLNMTLQARIDGRWQQVSATFARALAGANRVELLGRWHGQMVPARVLRLTVRATAAGRTSVTRTFSITVRHGQLGLGL